MVGVPTYRTGGNRSATVTTDVVKLGSAVADVDVEKAVEEGVYEAVTVSPKAGVQATLAVDVVPLLGLSVPVPMTF